MAATGVFLPGTVFRPTACLGVRNMVTLKELSMRVKSVKNIQKITKSMKMVSAAKFGRAEKELKSARSYGAGASASNMLMSFSEIGRKPPVFLRSSVSC
ncbi:hypothetical protein QZH41_012103 [Actinostola sp. cb2023]|nr:hypothetical protein QZH41_012103 [Actinostola sp. cb2023]